VKPLFFIGSAQTSIRSFPAKARQEAGYQLDQVQRGFSPSDWKPMKSVGKGVREIRIHEDGEYRVLYIATVGDSVYVLHAFIKKSQKTPKHDIELARKRLKIIGG